MQTFDTNTLEYEYIQALLYDTYIPTIPVFSKIPDDGTLASLYKQKVHSLIVGNSVMKLKEDAETYTLEPLQPYTFGKFYKGFTTNFKNKQNYYNTELHEALGNYLRFYNDYYDVDLMPLYNCFSNRYVDNFSLPIYAKKRNDNSTVIVGSTRDLSVRLFAVPVRNNSTYQVAIESFGTTLRAQLAYFDGNRLLSISDEVLHSFVLTTSFDSPAVINVSIDNFDYAFARYLYLFIEVPAENNSSIMILERYSENDLCINPSLLRTNLYSQRAFSDKLIQYLTGNAITPAEGFQTSIAELQDIMSSEAFYRRYQRKLPMTDFTRGTFNTGYNSTHSFIYNTFRRIPINYPGSVGPEPIRDFMGYIDSDIEYLILAAKEPLTSRPDVISTTGF